jgi:hypothetical protein
VFVHNESRVSSQYLRHVKASTDYHIGDDLPITSEYLRTALDRLTALGLIMLGRSWKRLGGELRTFKSHAWLLVLESASAQNWNVTLAVCSRLKSLPVSRSDQLFFQFHGWLATKESDGLATIREELDGFDTSGLEPYFEFSRRLLLDDLDGASRMLDTVLGPGGPLELAAIDQFPIYKAIRDHPALAKFRQPPA